MDGVLVTKNVSVKRFSFTKGGSIGDQERVCQILQLLQLERVSVIKNVSAKLFSFFNGVSIGYQERVCQTLQLLQWTEYWLPRTCLSNSPDSPMEGVLVIKNVPLKLISSFNGWSIGDQERVCQTLHPHHWRECWWWRMCLSNSSASSMEVVLGIKNVSVKLFSSFNGGSIGYQERVYQILQLLQWREYWGSRTYLSNSSVLQWREYWWWRTCLPNSSVSSMEGGLVIKNVSFKLYNFFNGESTGYQERVCQTLQLI